MIFSYTHSFFKLVAMFCTILIMGIAKTAYADKPRFLSHNHPEKHFKTTTEPTVLNISYSPSTGATGDLSFKVKYVRSGDGGVLCKKIDSVAIGSCRDCGPNGGDPIRFNMEKVDLCTFSKKVKAEFWDANSYFRDLCKNNIGKSFRTNIKTLADQGKYNNFQYSIPVNLKCACIKPSFSSLKIDSAKVGKSYSFSFSDKVRGGAKPLRFQLKGVIPPGMRFNKNGSISGTPKVPGEYNFSVAVNDSCATGTAREEQNFKLNVCAEDVGLLTPSNILPNGYKGSNYSFQLTANGKHPINYSVLDWRDLPRNVILSPRGLLTGVPSSSGHHRFTVVSEDSCGLKKETSVIININQNKGCQKLALYGLTDLPHAQMLQSYRYNFSISGLSKNSTIKLKNDSRLPEGLKFSTYNSQAAIVGTPKQPGKYKLTLIATSSCGNQSTSKSFNLNVIDITNTSGFKQLAPAMQRAFKNRISAKRTTQPNNPTPINTNNIVTGKKSNSSATTRPVVINLSPGIKYRKLFIKGPAFNKANAARIVTANNRPINGVQITPNTKVKGGRYFLIKTSSTFKGQNRLKLQLNINNRWQTIDSRLVKISAARITNRKTNNTTARRNNITNTPQKTPTSQNAATTPQGNTQRVLK